MSAYIRPISLRWADSDGDSDATISFYLNNNRLPPLRTEDADGANDQISLPASAVPPGSYTLNAAISDGTTEYRDTSCCQITVTQPDPTADGDGDLVPDFQDNCRFTYNPNQQDTGGFLTSVPDGIGNACQCGDVDANGVVNAADLSFLTASQNISNAQHLAHPELCNLTPEGECDQQDITVLSNALSSGTRPEQVCGAGVAG